MNAMITLPFHQWHFTNICIQCTNTLEAVCDLEIYANTVITDLKINYIVLIITRHTISAKGWPFARNWQQIKLSK